MDRVKRSLFLDPIDEVAANNLSDSQWIPNCDQDCDDQHDMAILENLIFPNEERSYNALDTQTSRKLKQAIREIFSDDCKFSHQSFKIFSFNFLFPSQFQNSSTNPQLRMNPIKSALNVHTATRFFLPLNSSAMCVSTMQTTSLFPLSRKVKKNQNFPSSRPVTGICCRKTNRRSQIC